MKFYTTLSILFLLFTTNTYAQEYLSKGHSILSGSFNITSGNTDYSKYNFSTLRNFSVSPSYGKFINDNLAIGIRTSYHNGKSTSNSINRASISKAKGYSVSVFLKKYYPINEKFGAYLNSNLGYSHRTNSYEVLNTLSDDTFGDSKDKEVMLSSYFGLYYFLWNRLSLEANLGNASIRKTIFEENSSLTRSGFNINFINNLSFDRILTINYYF